ncbi:hypothetical protein AVEN_182833-1, partial [Araneus ventricosus]
MSGDPVGVFSSPHSRDDSQYRI